MVNAWRRFFNAVTITILTHGLLDKNSHKSKENPKRVQNCVSSSSPVSSLASCLAARETENPLCLPHRQNNCQQDISTIKDLQD